MKELLRKYPVASVLVGFLMASIPLMILRDWSPSNELRYLSIADEALAGGHVWAFFNHGVPYADKPPFFLWLIMLCRLVAGSHCSLLLEALLCYFPASVTVIVLDHWLCDVKQGGLESGTRSRAALLTLTSVLFLGSALVLRMDMLMTMFIVLSLRSFHRIYRSDTEGVACKASEKWILPLWVFMALFTKGPVGILMPVASIAVFVCAEGNWRRIGRYLGLRTWGIIAVLCAIWLSGVYFEGGKEYLNNLLFHQTIDRAVSAFDHKQPFWFYFLYIWVVLLPFSPVLVWSWIQSFLHPEGRGSAEHLMALSSLVTFVMLSCFSSKLFIYLLPVCPMITAMFPLVSSRLGWTWNWGRWLSIYAVILAAGLLIAAPFMNGVNEKSSYGAFCKSIPAEDEVATLFVKRAENIDVYLGRSVAVFSSEEEFDSGWSGQTLVVKLSALEKKGSEALKSQLSAMDFWDVGAFRIYRPRR